MRFILILAVIAVAVIGGLWWENANFEAPGPAASETVVLVKSGNGLTQIATQLESSGVVDSALLFRAGVTRRGETAALKAGEYAVPAHASMADVLDMLVKHKAIEHKITIPEGYTSGMIADVVNKDSVLEGSPVAEPAEGTLLPETYLFERGTTRADIIVRMQKAQSDLIASLWSKRQTGLPYKNAKDAIVMASLVEKETGVPFERAHVTRVFLNRMAQGIKLESDPTIIYGLTKGIPLGHPLRVSELAKPNPYSTYQIVGLPPGPICNPGRSAIEASLNPIASNDLFFVANGTGGHAFAATLAEHQKNVVSWRQIEAARGAATQTAQTSPTAPALTEPAPRVEAQSAPSLRTTIAKPHRRSFGHRRRTH